MWTTEWDHGRPTKRVRFESRGNPITNRCSIKNIINAVDGLPGYGDPESIDQEAPVPLHPDAANDGNASSPLIESLLASQRSVTATEQVLLKQQKSDEVCFGMVCMSYGSIQAHPHRLFPACKTDRLTSLELDCIPVSQGSVGSYRHLTSGYPSIRATVKTFSKRTYACDESNNEYDVLDGTYSKILQVLVDDSDIALQAFVERLPLEDQQKGKSKQKRGQSPNCAISLSVIIYGSQVLSESIGSFFNKCSVYLQRPCRCDRNVPYRNPQSLSGQDEDAPLTMELEDHSSSSEIATVTESADLAAAIETADSFPETEAPVCIRTSLHR